MNLIAIVDRNWAIGRGGDQLIYLSADLKRFRALTGGHTVILGRKTLATFPGGRPLKGRRNLILSRDPDFQVEGGQVCRSPEEAAALADPDAFVLGGGTVYHALVDACDTAYLTQVDRAFPGADTWFPDLSRRPGWAVAETEPWQEEDGVPFRYVTWKKRG
jgi:dihydrofolate reductase